MADASFIACSPSYRYACLTAAQKKKATGSSKASTPASSRPGTPTKSSSKHKPQTSSNLSKSSTLSAEAGPSKSTASTSQLSQDLKGLGLDDEDVYTQEDVSTLPTISIAKEKLIEEIKQKELEADFKPVLSMVVIGEFVAF